MEASLIVLGVLVLLVIYIIAKGLVIVQQSETMVIERLGRYLKTLSSGINLIIPFIDKPRPMTWRITAPASKGGTLVRFINTDRIDLRENVYDFARQSVITRDNVVTEINAVLYFQIVEPLKAVYEISNLPVAIEMLTQTSLRNVIGEMDLDETLTSRDTINNKLRDILDEATNKWGVKVNRVELQDINPPRDIRDAMEKQMRAERDKRAQVLTAEGQKEAMIRESEGRMTESVNHAEGEKKAQILATEADARATILRAEAEAEAIERITSAVASTGSNPTQYLIAMRYLDTLEKIGRNSSDKTLFLPYEATGILSALGGIKEVSASEVGNLLTKVGKH